MHNPVDIIPDIHLEVVGGQIVSPKSFSHIIALMLAILGFLIIVFSLISMPENRKATNDETLQGTAP